LRTHFFLTVSHEILIFQVADQIAVTNDVVSTLLGLELMQATSVVGQSGATTADFTMDGVVILTESMCLNQGMQ
jgi:hypothetical protein